MKEKHQHKCARCGHWYDCTRGEPCQYEKRGLCGECFEKIASETEPDELKNTPGRRQSIYAY